MREHTEEEMDRAIMLRDLEIILDREIHGFRAEQKRREIMEQAFYLSKECERKKEERTITTTGYQSS